MWGASTRSDDACKKMTTPAPYRVKVFRRAVPVADVSLCMAGLRTFGPIGETGVGLGPHAWSS